MLVLVNKVRTWLCFETDYLRKNQAHLQKEKADLQHRLHPLKHARRHQSTCKRDIRLKWVKLSVSKGQDCPLDDKIHEIHAPFPLSCSCPAEKEDKASHLPSIRISYIIKQHRPSSFHLPEAVHEKRTKTPTTFFT
jgi:hypothetical protein